MSVEPIGLFEELTPPPGGAEGFARRLDELTAVPAAAPAGVQILGTAACLVLAALAASLWLREPDASPPQIIANSPAAIDLYGAPEFDRLLGRPGRPAELTVVMGTETATVTQLETANEKVRIYEIN